MKYTIHYLKDSKNKYYFIVKINESIILTSRRHAYASSMTEDAFIMRDILIGTFKIIDGTDPVPAHE